MTTRYLGPLPRPLGKWGYHFGGSSLCLMDRQGAGRLYACCQLLNRNPVSEEIMTQNQTGSKVLTSLLNGKINNRSLTTRQVNKLVAMINSRLTPAQQSEVKGFFVFNEAPSMSTRAAFETVAQTTIQNTTVLNAIVA